MASRRLVLATLALLVSLPPGAAAAAQELPAPNPPPAAPPANQDQAAPPRWQGGLGLMIGVPVGEFADNVDIAAGLTFQFDASVKRSPVSVGVEATYLWYGSQSRDVPLVGMPGLAVGVDTSNDMFLLHGRVRAQRQDGRVRPYVDGLVGFNYLVTTTSVDAEDTCVYVGSTFYCDDDGDSITDMDDLVLSAGGGGGIMIALGSGPQPMRLDLSLRYLYGGQAQYLTEEDIRWEGEGPGRTPRRSRTDMLVVYIGLAWGR